jgi:hypothetical protein
MRPPPQSCKCLPIFDPKKCYNPLSTHRTLQVYLRQTSFLQVENKGKGLHFAYVVKIQEAVTDELKKVKKE